MIDNLEPLFAVRIVGAADIQQLLEAELIAQGRHHIDDPLARRHQRQFAERDLRLDAQRPHHFGAQRGQSGLMLGLNNQGAHRSMVPVRRIFFCNCNSP